MKSLFATLRLLTVLPVGRGAPAPPPHCGLFPVVGAFVGLFGVAAGAVAALAWGDPLTGIAVVSAWALVTGGLHLDGLADSCDALFSWQTRERKLEILRDSRVGVMGVLGLMGVLAFQVAALHALGQAWWIGALLAPVWGRQAAAHAIVFFPAARGDGIGATVHAGARPIHALAGTLLALTTAAGVAGTWGALAAVVVLPATHLASLGMCRALGGLSGDSYGALVELAQTVSLLWLSALTAHGVGLACG